MNSRPLYRWWIVGMVCMFVIVLMATFCSPRARAQEVKIKWSGSVNLSRGDGMIFLQNLLELCRADSGRFMVSKPDMLSSLSSGSVVLVQKFACYEDVEFESEKPK